MTDWSTLKKLIWLRIIKGGGSALRTVTGAIVHVTNALAMPAKALTVNVEPIQDLHGYDSPWPDGGGRNLFQTTATTKTQSGVTWTINNDGSITASGTATNYTDLNAGEAIVAGLSETVTIYGDVSASENIVFGTLKLVDANDQTLETIYNGGTQTTHAVDLTQYSNAYKIVVTLKRNNNVATSGTYHIQVVKGTIVPAWQPYSNICPISGRTSATVTRTGKNLFDKNAVLSGKYLDVNTGLPVNAVGYVVSDYIPVIAGNPIYIPQTNSSRRWFYNEQKEPVIYLNNANPQAYIPLSDGYIRVTINVTQAARIDLDTFQIEYGSTASAYEPYQGNTYTIQLGDTVYGGTLDVTGGKFVGNSVIWARNTATMDNNENYPGWQNSGIKSLIGGGINEILGNQIMNIGTTYGANTSGNNDVVFLPVAGTASYGKTQTEWKALAIDVQIVIPLATPFEITLTPTQIDMLLGENNLWADAGDLTLTYYADGNASTSEALGILLGGTYNNPGGADDASDDEALGILLGGS